VDGNEAKMISTLGIWAAVASILIFSGLFNLKGDVFAFVIMIVVPCVLAGAAAGATKSVWSRPEPSAVAHAAGASAESR
jgi:hypothetical protein